MLVLDSGAEASVFTDVDLIPHPINVPMPIVSSMALPPAVTSLESVSLQSRVHTAGATT